jgi:NADH-quinone oxidoreductase subunit G
MTNLKKISIDGIEVEVDGAMTIIQAAEVAGVEIPRFCYHERLTIAGNCRCVICAPAPMVRPRWSRPLRPW